MSREVDERIVQMTFDSKQFEEGVQSTIKGLELLNTSVKGLTGVGKNVANYFKSLDLTNPISSAISPITVHLGTIGSIFDQFLRNRENQIEAFVISAVNKWNIFKGGMQSGLQEYETQIDAIQTIWANTKDAGTTMDDIKDSLDELNHYADMTIYNFTQMTRNIGTFTAAGVDLKTATTAIQGIANLAAISGSNSEQASRAMYQLSQAIAAGVVHLQDWNSVVNAGMGGRQFQKVIVETAREMGTITQEFANQINNNEINFRAALNKADYGDWFTSDVLTASLAKFTDLNTELGRTATDAATKVKTLSQLLDTLKEAVQSGWTQSWEWIIGDFDQARDLFTKISDKIQALIQPAMDARNSVLEFWSTRGKIGAEFAAGVDTVEDESKELERLANEVIAGKWGYGEARYEALKKAGYNYRKIQNEVNRITGYDANLFKTKNEWLYVDDNDEEIKKEQKQNEVLTGRQMALKGIFNIAQTVYDLFRQIRLAWRDIFPKKTGMQLVSMSEAFMNFSEKLKPSVGTLNKLRRTFRGVFSILGIGWKLIKALVKDGTDLLGNLFPNKDRKSILKFLAEFWDKVYDLNQSLTTDNILDKIGGLFSILGSKIKEFAINWAVGFKSLTGIDVLGWAQGVWKGFTTFIRELRTAEGFSGKLSVIRYTVVNFFKDTWETIKSKGSDIWNGLKKTKDKIVEFFSSITMDDVDRWVNAFKNTGIGALIFAIAWFVLRLSKLVGGKNGLMGITKETKKTIKDFRKSIVDFFDELNGKFKLSTLLQIATVIGVVTYCITKLAELDTGTMLACAGVLAGFVVLTGVFAIIMEKLQKDNNGKYGNIILSFAGLILAVYAVIMTFANFNDTDALIGSAIGTFVLLAALMGLMAGFVYAVPYARLKGVAASILAFAFAIDLLLVPIIAIGGLYVVASEYSYKDEFFTGLITSIITIAGLIVVMALAIRLITGSAGIGKSKILAAAASILAMALAINMMIVPIAAMMVLLKIDTAKAIEGFGLIGGLLLVMASAIYILHNINNKRLKAASLAFLMMGVVIAIFGKVVKKLVDVTKGAGYKKVLSAAGSIGILLAAIAGSLFVLGKRDWKELAAAGVAMAAMMLALNLLVPVFTAVANITSMEPMWTLVGVIIALAGAITILGYLDNGFLGGFVRCVMVLIGVLAIAAAVIVASTATIVESINSFITTLRSMSANDINKILRNIQQFIIGMEALAPDAYKAFKAWLDAGADALVYGLARIIKIVADGILLLVLELIISLRQYLPVILLELTKLGVDIITSLGWILVMLAGLLGAGIDDLTNTIINKTRELYRKAMPVILDAGMALADAFAVNIGAFILAPFDEGGFAGAYDSLREELDYQRDQFVEDWEAGYDTLHDNDERKLPTDYIQRYFEDLVPEIPGYKNYTSIFGDIETNMDSINSKATSSANETGNALTNILNQYNITNNGMIDSSNGLIDSLLTRMGYVKQANEEAIAAQKWLDEHKNFKPNSSGDAALLKQMQEAAKGGDGSEFTVTPVFDFSNLFTGFDEITSRWTNVENVINKDIPIDIEHMTTFDDGGLQNKMDEMMNMWANMDFGQDIYLDTDTLVGATADKYNDYLGKQSVLSSRRGG